MAAPALGTAETGQAVWTGRIVNRDISGGRTENVAIYSDIAAATEETFAKAYGGLDTAGTIKVVESERLLPQQQEQEP